jgi:hypothetical protein
MAQISSSSSHAEIDNVIAQMVDFAKATEAKEASANAKKVAENKALWDQRIVAMGLPLTNIPSDNTDWAAMAVKFCAPGKRERIPPGGQGKYEKYRAAVAHLLARGLNCGAILCLIAKYPAE